MKCRLIDECRCSDIVNDKISSLKIRIPMLGLLHLMLYELPHCDFHHIDGDLSLYLGGLD